MSITTARERHCPAPSFGKKVVARFAVHAGVEESADERKKPERLAGKSQGRPCPEATVIGDSKRCELVFFGVVAGIGPGIWLQRRLTRKEIPVNQAD